MSWDRPAGGRRFDRRSLVGDVDEILRIRHCGSSEEEIGVLPFLARWSHDVNPPVDDQYVSLMGSARVLRLPVSTSDTHHYPDKVQREWVKPFSALDALRLTRFSAKGSRSASPSHVLV